jgi:uncharacterized Fe-S cluster-containing protein
LTRIQQKTARSRCTACKRSRRIAVAEQAVKREPCPLSGCEFVAEIAEEIENRRRLKIVPKEKKRVHITEKQSTKINFIKRK